MKLRLSRMGVQVSMLREEKQEEEKFGNCLIRTAYTREG